MEKNLERNNLREEKISHDQEEGGAASKDIVVVLVDICKSSGASLCNRNIDNEMT